MDRPGFLARWSQFFISKYKTTILIVLAIVIAGAWGAMNNQRQDFPTIPSNFIFVTATQPGASAEDMEQNVLVPLEQQLTDLDGLNVMRTSASNSFATVVLDMADVEGTEAAADEVDTLVSRAQLPAGVETEVEILDVTGPTVVYALSSDERSPAEMVEYLDVVESRLLSASNAVDRIETIPGNDFEIVVELDADEVNDRRLSVSEIQQSIQGALTSFPGGSITTESETTLAISVDAGVESLDALREVEVNGTKLDDIANIDRVAAIDDQITLAGYVDADGTPISREGVYLFVYKQAEGDVIRLSDALVEEAEKINAEEVLPENVELVELYTNADYVQQQIDDLLFNGWLGLGLILVVLMFFINLRTGIIVAAIIPLAFLITLGVLYAIGFTINILTLFGLLLVLGILVDNAIVVAEGVTHAIEAGKTRAEAVIYTMTNLGPAVTAATLTTVVVFIPFASIGGIVGAFLKFIPYTIIITLLASYFLAVTITPVLSRYFMKEETKEERRGRSLKSWEKITVLPAILWGVQRAIDWLEDRYGDFAGWLHQHKSKKVIAVVLTGVLLVSSIGGFAGKLDVEQFPNSASTVISVSVDAPKTATFDQKRDAVARVMEEVVKTEDFISYYSFDGILFVVVEEAVNRSSDKDIFEIQEDIESRLAVEITPELADQGLEVSTEVLSNGPPESSWDVTIELRGASFDDLEAAAADLTAEITSWEDVEEAQNGFVEGLVPGVAVTLDQDEIRDRGLNAAVVNGAVNSMFAEQQVGSLAVRNDGVTDDIVLRFNDEAKRSLDDIRDLEVVPFTTVDDVATVEEVEESQNISRLDQKRVVQVQFKVKEDVVPMVAEQRVRDYLTQEHLDQFNLQAEDISYGGFSAQLNDNYDDLVLVFILAIIAVYLILVYQFNSYIQPGLILLTVPMALIAVFPALLWVKSSINMISGLGIVALVGIVVNDAIVFMDYYNRLRRENPKWELSKVFVETGRARFKPILSTSITTVFGILPLTIVDPFWRGLGTALSAGLISATVGTLIVFPIFLSWNEWFMGFCRRRWEGLKKKMKRA